MRRLVSFVLASREEKNISRRERVHLMIWGSLLSWAFIAYCLSSAA